VSKIAVKLFFLSIFSGQFGKSLIKHFSFVVLYSDAVGWKMLVHVDIIDDGTYDILKTFINHRFLSQEAVNYRTYIISTPTCIYMSVS